MHHMDGLCSSGDSGVQVAGVLSSVHLDRLEMVMEDSRLKGERWEIMSNPKIVTILAPK